MIEKKEEVICLERDYKDRVQKIWEEHKNNSEIFPEDQIYRKHALLPKSIHKNRLLFIGMNPSFEKKSTIPKDEENIFFYPVSYENSKSEIPYFKRFGEVASSSKIKWTHLDLLFIRETNQKSIEKLTYIEDGINFLNMQLDISFEIIEKSEPKLIVVANAFAAEFFGKKKSKHGSFNIIWKGYNLIFQSDDKDQITFNEEIGTYEIQLNGKKVPIIFSGMLSGQRALDVGSLERLKWQIKMILEGKKMK
jgi:hypothetical protein